MTEKNKIKKTEKPKSEKIEKARKKDTGKSRKKSPTTRAPGREKVTKEKNDQGIKSKQEIGDKGQGKKKEPTTMAELLAQSEREIKSLRYGQLIEGTVIHKGKRELLVDIGAKSEGIITGTELEDPDDTFRKIEVGRKILASLVQAENDQGYIVLSLRRAAPERKWRELYEAHETGGNIKVTVLEYNKGGLVVDVSGLRGFVPLSHLDRAHLPMVDRSAAGGSHAEIAKKLRPLMGKMLTTQVIEIDRHINRLVLSEKDAIAEKIEARRAEALKAVKTGDAFDGVVSGIMPFGLFVRLRDPNGEDIGLEGLVHVSELSWERKFSVGRDYKVGDEVRVQVLEADPSQDKLALSMKALIENPWDNAVEKYPIGSKIKGKVTKIVPYGAFVNLEPGLDGLIHVSETVGPLAVGEEVEAVVINLTPGERRMGLSVRRLGVSTPSRAKAGATAEGGVEGSEKLKSKEEKKMDKKATEKKNAESKS